MKRRSFLAMLGLAPVAGAASAKAATQKSISRHVLDGDVPIPAEAISRNWICPSYQARCDAAAAAGLPRPAPASFRLEQVEPTTNHCGIEMQYLDDDGRVVYRQWNRK